MKKHNYNTLGAIVAAVIHLPIRLGLYELSDIFYQDTDDGTKNAICTFLSIIISVAITLVIIWILQKVGKSKHRR